MLATRSLGALDAACRLFSGRAVRRRNTEEKSDNSDVHHKIIHSFLTHALDHIESVVIISIRSSI